MERSAWLVRGVSVVAIALASCGLVLGAVVPHFDPSARWLAWGSEMALVVWLPFGEATLVASLGVLLLRDRRAALVLFVLGALVVGPELLRRVTTRPTPASASSLRIGTMNLAGQNTNDPGMTTTLESLDADVLVLTEYTYSWEQRLRPWLQRSYPRHWHTEAAQIPGLVTDDFRIAIASRLENVAPPTIERLDRINCQMRVCLRFGDRTFALYGVHPQKPFPYPTFAGTTTRQRAQLVEWIEREELPALIAGDFNSPPGSAFLRRFEALGYGSASIEARGEAPRTWPMTRHERMPFMPFLVAIDHVFASSEFRVLDFERGPRTRSDHAPIVATIEWRRDAR